jgi:hypothetical protein
MSVLVSELQSLIFNPVLWVYRQRSDLMKRSSSSIRFGKKKSNLEVRVEGDTEVGLHVVQRRCKIMVWVVWSNSASPVDIVTR